jgi:hypothetical protein
VAHTSILRWAPVALALGPLGLNDLATPQSSGGPRLDPSLRPRTACEGNRPRLPDVLTFRLRRSAFPSQHADVAVHVPQGFDATRRPGLVLYFHGWQGCVEAALAPTDVACTDGGSMRQGGNVAAQVDSARINAVVVAMETREDAQTGEPGELAMPGAPRELLQELFTEKLSGSLGCAIDADRFDRTVVIAHSGGYQALASVLQTGDLPRITEVIMLDALYGGEDVLARWVADDLARFDPRLGAALRLVDLYTCCGGTVRGSRSTLERIREVVGTADIGEPVYYDDSDQAIAPAVLRHPIVFKRVPDEHSDLPRVYVRLLLENAGISRLPGP